jgi:hypothetical protein
VIHQEIKKAEEKNSRIFLRTLSETVVGIQKSKIIIFIQKLKHHS